MAPNGGVSVDPVLRLRNLVFASDALLIVVLCVLAAVHHQHWRWSLVIWGLLIGLGGWALMELVTLIALRTLDIPSSRREIPRRRRPVYLANAITLGASFGIVSAVLGTAAFDIFGAAITLISLIAGVVLALRIVRKRRRGAAG